MPPEANRVLPYQYYERNIAPSDESNDSEQVPQFPYLIGWCVRILLIVHGSAQDLQ